MFLLEFFTGLSSPGRNVFQVNRCGNLYLFKGVCDWELSWLSEWQTTSDHLVGYLEVYA